MAFRKRTILPALILLTIGIGVTIFSTQNANVTHPLATDEVVNQGMKFSVRQYDTAMGSANIIYGEGPIIPGTAQQLVEVARQNNLKAGDTIYLQSEGGDLLEGMELGQTIRQLGFNTFIGANKNETPSSYRGNNEEFDKPIVTKEEIIALVDKIAQEEDMPIEFSRGIMLPQLLENVREHKPGYCLSACTLAYLGGISRFIYANDIYGVHRFYRDQGRSQKSDLDAAQLISGEIIRYIKDMGVDPKLFQIMTLAGKDELLRIDRNTLLELNAVNDGILETKWEITANEGGVYLRGWQKTDLGNHRLSFLCGHKNPQIMGMAFYDSPNPQTVVDNASFYKTISYDSTEIEIPDSKVTTNNSYVLLMFGVDHTLASHLVGSKEIGIGLESKDRLISAGFSIRQTDESRALMKNYFRDCHENLVKVTR